MVKTRTKSEEKRQKMMASASELFMKQGFSSTSMDQIASHAGVSKQTLYSHFGNKDDLFTAAIADKCETYQMSDAMFTGDDPKQVLMNMGQLFSNLLLSEDSLRVFRLCIAESDSNSKLAGLFFDAGPKRVIGMFSNYLERLNTEGLLRVSNPHFAAVQLLTMLQGEARMFAELGLAERIDLQQHQQYLEDCVDMFLQAYRVE